MITFDPSELSEFAKRAREAADTVVQISINDGLRKLGKLIVPTTGTGALANETPKVTGKLRRSTVFQIIGGAMGQALEIRQAARSQLGVFYGFIVREGRGAVHAVNAKALHFWIGEKEFFRKSVGPAEANPYHIRVLNRLKPQIQKIVDDMGQRVTAYISGIK